MGANKIIKELVRFFFLLFFGKIFTFYFFPCLVFETQIFSSRNIDHTVRQEDISPSERSSVFQQTQRIVVSKAFLAPELFSRQLHFLAVFLKLTSDFVHSGV